MEMNEIYSELFWRLFDDLGLSLDPAGPDELYEVAAPFMAAGKRVLDVGCRDARHLIELVRRHNIIGIGVDPVAWHVERAQTASPFLRTQEQHQACLPPHGAPRTPNTALGSNTQESFPTRARPG